MAQQLDLPLHMYQEALEEHLLLSALRSLSQAANCTRCPPAVTMASRNDLIALAHEKLDAASLETFLGYARSLGESFSTGTLVAFPPPVGDFCPEDPLAEQMAWHHLSESRGSVWSSVRSVVSALNFSEDARACASGLIFTLGAYVIGGITGLTKHTGAHVNTCRLLNRMVKLVCPALQWSSLAVLIDNQCGPHHDKWNWRGLSLLIGLSHHNDGGLWIEAPGGKHYEMVGEELVAGDVYPTSARGIAFLSKTQLHATCEWRGCIFELGASSCAYHVGCLFLNSCSGVDRDADDRFCALGRWYRTVGLSKLPAWTLLETLSKVASKSVWVEMHHEQHAVIKAVGVVEMLWERDVARVGSIDALAEMRNAIEDAIGIANIDALAEMVIKDNHWTKWTGLNSELFSQTSLSKGCTSDMVLYQMLGEDRFLQDEEVETSKQSTSLLNVRTLFGVIAKLGILHCVRARADDNGCDGSVPDWYITGT
ncbi:unnamed protein product [Symbiodinium microadriaticum]|nr:unnamed protein product [Symbiodinium microadriaticum]